MFNVINIYFYNNYKKNIKKKINSIPFNNKIIGICSYFKLYFILKSKYNKLIKFLKLNNLNYREFELIFNMYFRNLRYGFKVISKKIINLDLKKIKKDDSFYFFTKSDSLQKKIKLKLILISSPLIKSQIKEHNYYILSNDYLRKRINKTTFNYNFITLIDYFKNYWILNNNPYNNNIGLNEKHVINKKTNIRKSNKNS